MRKTAATYVEGVRAIGYRSILVPLADNSETEQALDVACRLAAEHGSSITAVAVVEVPLSCRSTPTCKRRRQARRRSFAVRTRSASRTASRVDGRIVRARDAGPAIAEEANARHVELVVIGARRGTRKPFSRTVETVLKRSESRVLVIAPPASGDRWRAAA